MVFIKALDCCWGEAKNKNPLVGAFLFIERCKDLICSGSETLHGAEHPSNVVVGWSGQIKIGI
jgi:hypothetical protein